MTSSSMPTQILSFDDFGALEAHLRILKGKYNDIIKKYEETLGFILRDTSPGSNKVQKGNEKWAHEMQRTMASAAKAPIAKKKEESKPSLRLFGSNKDNGKQQQQEASNEWIILDPMSVFVGPKNKGLAEIYFDTVNVLRENVNKINLALSICSTLKVKVSATGNTSLVVAFVNGLPTKVVLKSANDKDSKKYAMAFSFTVPSVRAT